MLIAAGVILAIIAGTIALAIERPGAAVYLPIFSIGLALALQKYTASFSAYFAINLGHIYDVGNRIRMGNIKGDVRHVGLIHTTLEEVGEDEKLGGELTGRILYVPNLLILDQAVLNFSKNYSVNCKYISSDYMFDEVRIPLSTSSNAQSASELLERILKAEDEIYIAEASRIFQEGYPHFLDEATQGPRVLISVEPQHIWIKGKFVTPVCYRNELRTKILLRFMKEAKANPNIQLA